MSVTGGIAGWGLAFAPMLSPWAVAAFAAAAGVLLTLGVWRGARGLWWRAAGLAVLLLILLDPSLVRERREPQKDVAIIIVDEIGLFFVILRHQKKSSDTFDLRRLLDHVRPKPCEQCKHHFAYENHTPEEDSANVMPFEQRQRYHPSSRPETRRDDTQRPP